MPTIASLNVALTATASQLDATLKAAGGKIAAFASGANKALGLDTLLGKTGNAAANAVGALKGVKEQFEQFAPGIALVGAALVAVDAFAKGVDQASNELLTGKKTAAEFGVATLAAIPGAQLVADFGTGLREAFWNGTAALSDLVGMSDKFTKSLRTNASIAAEIAEANEQAAKFNAANDLASKRVRTLEQELALLNAASDAERERLAIEQERENRLNALENNPLVTDRRRAAEIEQIEAVAKAKQRALDRQLADEQLKRAAEVASKAAAAAAKSHAEKLKQIAVEAKAREDAEKRFADLARQDQKKLESAATALVQSIATPIEQYTDKLGEIDDLLANNAITAETAKRAAEQARDAAGLGPKREILAGIAERGTAAAFANTRRAIDGTKIDKEQLAELKKISTTLAARIAQPPAPIEVVSPGAL